MTETERPAQRWEAHAVVALLAGLALRAVFVWKHPRFVGDTLVYGDLAHNLLTHHVYGLTEGGHVRATLIRLPGYPLFLALCFALFGTANYLAVVWVQVALDLLGCWLLGRLAERLFGPRAALACVWMAALCPFTANYAAAALTETLSIFCVVVAFWGMAGWMETRGMRPAAAVGAALCGAVLLRPDGVLLAGAVLPAMAWRAWRGRPGGVGRRLRAFGPHSAEYRRLSTSAASLLARAGWWRGLAVCGGMLAVCLGAWTARNWRLYHVVQPLAPKYANDPGEPAPLGFARWYRTWGVGLADTARVYWEYDGSVLSFRDLPRWAFDGPGQRRETERVYGDYNAESSSTPRIEREFAALAAAREHLHPVRTFALMPLARLGDMWVRPRTELMQGMPLDWWAFGTRPWAAVFGGAYGLLNLALLGAAAVGLGRWCQDGWRGRGLMAVAMVGYVALRSMLLMTIDNSEPRYVLEGYPVVLLLAAVGVLRGGLRRAEAGSLREEDEKSNGPAIRD